MFTGLKQILWGPGPRDPTETGQNFVCLLRRYGSAVACRRIRDSVQQTWVWPKPSQRRLPLTPPKSHQNLHRTGETDTWREKTKPCVHQDPGEKEQWPHKILTQTCPWVSRSFQQRRGSVVACCRVRGTECSNVHIDLLRGIHYRHYLHHSLASGQTTGWECSPTHQQKIWVKIYWTWFCPSEQDLVFPSVSLFHQEASISLLSLSIRGRTEWKTQSQKTNQTDRIDHSLV